MSGQLNEWRHTPAPENNIKCPKCNTVFALGWRKVKTLRNELQHHLYMADHIDVIESHRLADEATAGLQQRVWKKPG